MVRSCLDNQPPSNTYSHFTLFVFRPQEQDGLIILHFLLTVTYSYFPNSIFAITNQYFHTHAQHPQPRQALLKILFFLQKQKPTIFFKEDIPYSKKCSFFDKKKKLLSNKKQLFLFLCHKCMCYTWTAYIPESPPLHSWNFLVWLHASQCPQASILIT